MSLKVTLSHGRDKLEVELPGPKCTVSELKQAVFDLTGIPKESQKIIFKGKTLQNDDMTLEDLKVTNNSKMILLGRKVAESEEPSVKEMNRIGLVVDGIESKLAEVETEVEGMEKGFLPKENVMEACRGLQKRCATCSELLMQNTEQLDAVDIPPSETMIRNRRKSAIRRIQLLLEMADKLELRIDQCRTTSS